jgi:hypothetical protein
MVACSWDIASSRITGALIHSNGSSCEREVEGRDHSHVVVERQPACDPVIGAQADGMTVGLDVPEHRSVRQHDGLLQAGRPGGVLKQAR